MKTFVPCQGKTACRDNGAYCLTCGRSLEEIAALRELMEQLASLAIEHGYTNVDDYADYIARKLKKSITYRQQQMQEQNLVQFD